MKNSTLSILAHSFKNNMKLESNKNGSGIRVIRNSVRLLLLLLLQLLSLLLLIAVLLL